MVSGVAREVSFRSLVYRLTRVISALLRKNPSAAEMKAIKVAPWT